MSRHSLRGVADVHARAAVRARKPRGPSERASCLFGIEGVSFLPWLSRLCSFFPRGFEGLAFSSVFFIYIFFLRGFERVVGFPGF